MKKWLLMGAVLWLLFSYIFSEEDSGKVESNFTPQIVKTIKKKLQPEITKVQKKIEQADRSIAQSNEAEEEDYSSEFYEKNRLKQILCFYRKNNIPFADSPNSMYFADMMFRVKENSEDETRNYKLFVKSADCQAPLFSRIDIQDDQGAVTLERNTDCNRTSKEELFLTEAVLPTISFIGDENPDIKNLAISGAGYFLMACMSNGRSTTYVSRKGNFVWDYKGHLVSPENSNCSLMGGFTDGVRPVTRENIDRFQVVDIQSSDVRNSRLIGKGILEVDFSRVPTFFPRVSTNGQDASSVFENYLEGTDAETDELGFYKDMWSKEDPSISCEDAEEYFRRIEQKDASE